MLKKVLLVEKSGDLVGCHGFPTDRLTQRETLKDRATQLLKSRSGGALVLTQSLFVLVLATCERTDTEE